MSKTFTKADVERMAPNGRDAFMWCRMVPGFGVRCKASGRKTYIIRYRTGHGYGRMFTLGRCCDMEPSQARDRARALFVRIREGHDPAAERTGDREALNVSELLDMYIERHAVPYKKPSSVRSDRYIIDRYLKPKLGKLPVVEVTMEDVSRLHAGMRATPIQANRVIAVLSKAFSVAERWGLRPKGSHPVKGHPRYRENPREKFLTIEQVRAVFRELEGPAHHPSFSRLVRLLLLTGCRLGEIMRARTEWIDWERGLLVLPDAKTGGRKVAIPPSALALVSRDSVWLCPGTKAGCHFRSPWEAWRRVRRSLGLGDVRLHDLRHTVGSIAHEAGLSQRQVADLLGHRNLGTTSRYIHAPKGSRPADVVASIIAPV